MNFFNELQRRNVFRVGFAYAVVGWLVAQVADLALESFGAPAWVMKTLLFLMLVGFVLSLFIAWAYELTPEGIKRAQDVEPDESITRQTGRKLDRLVIVVLMLTVGLLLAERFWIASPVATPGQPVQSAGQALAKDADSGVSADQSIPEPVPGADEASVAVLPFVNMSSDPEQEYFSDGISEEILNVLTRIPNLKVAARTSSFQFKGQNLDIADIGKQLQVNHLLEGSVRKSGNTLRITAQLIETDTGFHLWSETFDRNLEDVFAIQDEIAAAIAGELRTLLSDGVDISTTPVDMRAYELYLKGRGLVARRKPADIFTGIDVLNRALEIEPQYAPALATIAKAYVLLPWFSNKIPAGEAREQARNWAEKSLGIDSENVEALAVLAIVYNELDFNPVGALELLHRAVKSNPGSVVANNFLGDVYYRVGDLDNAMIYESRAAELDPLGPVQLTDLASVHLQKGDYQSAVNLCNQALKLDPTFMHALRYLGDAYYFLGDAEQLDRIYQVFNTIPDVDQARLFSVQVALDLVQGKQDHAENSLRERVLLVSTGKLSPIDVVIDAIQLEDFDTAGQMLLQAYREKDGRWIYPLYARLPEQAPDSKPWQEFWIQPAAKAVADLRRNNGLIPIVPPVGSGKSP